jgi:DNA-directed RNA polymerase alpha subunit
MDATDQNLPLTGLSARAQAAVRAALAGRAVTRENLQSLTQRALFAVPGVGRQTLKEVIGWAAMMGLRLPRG